MRNKGKVHPFTSSSSTSPNKDNLSVLKLLPAAIFTLITVLSLSDREVLAYMITRSLQTTNPSFLPSQNKQKASKKQSCDGHGRTSPALFDCDCFHCYTSFWFRWDSSPNRELIHQAIEAFEEHLSNDEEFKKSGNSKNKRKEKMGRRKSESISGAGDCGSGFVYTPAVEVENIPAVEVVQEENIPVVVQQTSHKGLARKMMPDVMGIFNSRLWSLWSPNV